MRKKGFMVMVMVAALLMIGGMFQSAEARRVYVGTYRDDGSDAYLLTESVEIHSRRQPYEFTCTVYATGDYLRYHFFRRNGSSYYTNSEGYEGFTFGAASPVAAGIYRFVVNNY